MDISIHKGQVLGYAQKALVRGATVQVLLSGDRVEVIGLQSRPGSTLVEAKLEDGYIMVFDASDPFAIITNG